jgi:hypothetical protein
VLDHAGTQGIEKERTRENEREKPFLKKGFLSCSFPKNFSCEKNLPQKAEGSLCFSPQNDSFGQWVFFFVKLFSFSEKKKV